MQKLSALLRMEVINLADGNRLGYVSDVEISEDARVTALYVKGTAQLMGICQGVFHRQGEITIPFSRVKKIGSDIVIVDIAGSRLHV